MDYYLKPSAIILSSRTLLFAVALLTCFLIVTSEHPHYWWLISNLFMSVLWIYPVARLFFYWMSGKPAITANDLYIQDWMNQRLYYWEDIEDAVADYGYLKINLYQTQKHPIKLYSFLSRLNANGFSRRSKDKISFYIYIDALDIDADDFLETLNNYSIVAEEKS